MASAVKNKTMRAGSARLITGGLLLLGVLLGVFDAPEIADRVAARLGIRQPPVKFESLVSKFPYRLGLDIQGGTHLTYQADVSGVSSADRAGAMSALRDVIERRVNLFGVAEPLVVVEQSGKNWRLAVELAGIKDIGAAIRLIGETPYLEFKEERASVERDAIIAAQKKGEPHNTTLADPRSGSKTDVAKVDVRGERTAEDPNFISTDLTGRYIQKADIDFDKTTFQPLVSLQLTGDGAKIFADLTKRNIGRTLAIYLDGVVISAPVVREAITGGRAQITGNFTPESAKVFAGRLNAGALPVPIHLIAQQSVEASLGREAFANILRAGVIGFLAVALFMILWYRLPGLLAATALCIYTAITLAIFKLIPVTITLAGIAGFILSIGMAVDANILIFERLKEELRRGLGLDEAIREGFARAWTSIRDSNVSSLLTAAVLYWLGTSMVKGFALTLGIGIVISMFSAISITRTFLFAATTPRLRKMKILFTSGFST